MKIFDIIDDENKNSVGTLLYYEKEKTFICELSDDLDEWSAPFLFTGFVRKGIYTIPRDESFNWVRSRIIPPSRQNIDLILRHHKLKEYDECIFLEISRGKCSQDSMYVKPVKELPGYVAERQSRNLTGCFLLRGREILCIYADETVMKTDLAMLSDEKDVSKVLENEELFRSGKLGTGGYFITFNNSIDIPAYALYGKGERIPLTPDDLKMMAIGGLVDTSAACDIMSCSRQNLSYMIGKGALSPLMEDVKGNLFLKDDVIRNMW